MPSQVYRDNLISLSPHFAYTTYIFKLARDWTKYKHHTMKTDKQWRHSSFLSHPSATEGAVCKIHDLATISAGPVRVGKGTQTIWTLWRKLLKIPSCCDMTPFGLASSDYVLEGHTDRPTNLKYLLPPRTKSTYLFNINQHSINLISASFKGTITKEILTDT